jgi:hypothetical protein
LAQAAIAASCVGSWPCVGDPLPSRPSAWFPKPPLPPWVPGDNATGAIRSARRFWRVMPALGLSGWIGVCWACSSCQAASRIVSASGVSRSLRRSTRCWMGCGLKSAQRDHLNKGVRWQEKARTWPQCTKLDPGAALRPQTAHSFDCLDAASPSRIHSSACLRSIPRAKGSSAFSAAWRQSLAWCSHNSTCDNIGPTSCGHLTPAGRKWRSPGWLHRCHQCPFVMRSGECVQVGSLNFRHTRSGITLAQARGARTRQE